MSGQPTSEDDDVRKLSRQLHEELRLQRQWFETKLAEAETERAALAEGFWERGIQLEQMSAELAKVKRHLASQEEVDRIYAQGMLPAVAGEQTGPHRPVQDHPVPAQRRGGHAAHRTPKDKRWLRSVPAVIPVGALALFKPLSTAFKASWAAHPVATAAAGTVASTVATGTAAVVVAPHGVVAQAFGAVPVASAPADGISSATPIAGPSTLPSALPVAAFMTKPKTSAISSLPLYDPPSPRSYAYVPPAYNPPPQQGQGQGSQQQAPAQQQPGRPVIQLDTTAIDLTGVSQATVTVTATGGGGWVSWRVDTGGSDLDFSSTHGVLAAGQNATIIVSVDAAQALDGNLSQTFDVNGQPVTVSLPPLPVPVVVPTATATAFPLPTSS